MGLHKTGAVNAEPSGLPHRLAVTCNLHKTMTTGVSVFSQARVCRLGVSGGADNAEPSSLPHRLAVTLNLNLQGGEVEVTIHNRQYRKVPNSDHLVV
jgi:hypothetical protein